jgi:phosphate transport system substrate-binding protein
MMVKLSAFTKGSRAKLAGATAFFALLAVLPLQAQVNLTGVGATFPAPIYQKWFNDYQSVDSSVQINYQAIGSGAGIGNVTQGVVDFGASDGPMTDEQMAAYKQAHGFGILHFPTVLGAAVPTYNIPGVTGSLRFTPEVLAGIYLGQIKKWNDSKLTQLNPGAHLPDLDIVVVHRSDGSGTTYIWTDYLSKISPEWKSKVGRNTSVRWPVGLGGKGNDGVAGIIKGQKGSIGYVELIYAIKSHLDYGMIKNKSGNFVKASLSSVTAAAAGVAMPADFRVSITDASGANAYPVSSFTWLLVPSEIKDPGKRKAMVGFLQWAVTKGQDDVESLDYAKLPSAVVAKEKIAIGKIK